MIDTVLGEKLSTGRAVVRAVRPRFLLTTIQVDGVVRYRLPILRAMQEQGWETHVATPDKGALEELQDYGIRTHQIAVSRGSTNPVQEYQTLRRFKDLLQTVRPELSHHFSTKAVIFGCLPNVGLNVATITGIGYSLSGPNLSYKHLPVRLVAKSLYRAALSRCDKVIFQNSHDEELFVSKGIASKSKSQIIAGSGIDMQYFHPSKRHRENGPVRFVLLARMLISKGVEDFAKAAVIVKDKLNIPCEFILAGPLDPENPACVTRAQISKWEQEGPVRWIGPVTDAVEAYADADVAVLPSYYNEGLSRSLVEAAAMALPIITTSNPGCADVVEEGLSGLIVPMKDASALADAMCQLAADPKARHSMGLRGRYFVEGRYSLEKVLEQVLNTYEDVLSRGGKTVAS